MNQNIELVSSILAIDTTEPVSQPVTQMAVELIERKGRPKGVDETHQSDFFSVINKFVLLPFWQEKIF